MKKAIAICSVAAFLFGCSSTQAADEYEDRFKTIHNEEAYGNDIIMDVETHCKYIKYNSAGGITPLLRGDGRPDFD